MYNNKPKTVSRGSQLAQIHIAKKELGMDDETYRLFLNNHTGKTSSAKLEMHERFKVIKAFEDAGWKSKNKKYQRKKSTSYIERQSRYMIALWNDLFKLKKVNSKTNVSFETWIARQINEKGQELPVKINPDNLDANQRNKLTEMLKVWVERK